MKAVVEIVAVALLCSLFFILGTNSERFEAKRAEDSAYKQGYKDALYKRPVSEELDMVCAGLWVGQENAKYQKRDK
jgi:hypothetical protein